MSKKLVAVLGAALLVGVVGCQTDKGVDDDADVTVRTESTDTMRATDDCSHCAGVQKARSDGTCPECNAKVTTAR
ncbi:MAG TPA: hypothetical protein VFB66_03080 [Tepidisphaeraceae bacterium]|nr:hypothetical protein [Tepidisphaeraceae bacterium]